MLKKFISILFFLFSLSTISFSQVSFDLDFTFPKIAPEDELVSLQLLDYNDDGSDEIIAGFSNEENDEWRIVCYSQTGDTLEIYTQEYQENEVFLKSYVYKDSTTSYIISAFVEPEIFPFQLCDIYIIMKIYDFETFTLIDTLSNYIGYSYGDGLYTFDVNFIKPLVFNENLIIYVGLDKIWNDASAGGSTATNIFKYSLNDNNLSFIEELEGCGANLIKYNTFDYLISMGYDHYFDGICGGEYSEYSINFISSGLISSVNQVYCTYGNIVVGYFYEDFPFNFHFITNNDSCYTNYGMTIYFRQIDDDYGTRDNFICFNSDFSDTLWISNESEILFNSYYLRTSTCINTNLGNHYLLYFSTKWGGYPPMLEIRNRITGNIELSQESSISPFTIKRTSDNELLFFVDAGNEYEVYTVNDIYLGVDDEYSNVANLYQLSNYPNPFRAETTISFNLTKESATNLHELTQIKIYNIKGQFVKELGIRISGCEFGEAIWDGTDEKSKPVPSGIYLYKLKREGKLIALKKCLIIR